MQNADRTQTEHWTLDTTIRESRPAAAERDTKLSLQTWTWLPTGQTRTLCSIVATLFVAAFRFIIVIVLLLFFVLFGPIFLYP